MGKGKMQDAENFFLKNTGLLFHCKRKILNIFKSKIFPIKNHDPVP